MSETNMEEATEEAWPVQRTMAVNVGLNLRIAHLQVLGRTLAHVAHDVQNHLAIINESAGWMGDVLKLKNKQRFGKIARFFKRDQGQRLDVKPFFRGLNAIQEQVLAGSTLTQHLSSFAHRLEETRSVFNGNKALEEIQEVLLRQADQDGIRLELKLTEEAPMIEADAPLFQLVVFSNVEQIVEDLESGDWVALEAEVMGNRYQVHLTSPCSQESPGLAPEESDAQGFFREIMEQLGGEIWRESSNGKQITTLAFPLASMDK